MKLLLSVTLCLILLGSCKETIQNVQLDALMKLITNGQWKVTRFNKGPSDITADFSVYLFQFKSNGTVDAIKNGVVEKTGTWVGNATDRTIQSHFSGVSEPLMLLNGTWYVTKTSTTYVESNQTVDGENRVLRLDKD